jgi:hypothetical protein
VQQRVDNMADSATASRCHLFTMHNYPTAFTLRFEVSAAAKGCSSQAVSADQSVKLQGRGQQRKGKYLEKFLKGEAQ